jgi:predicted AlkP superfamily phosphohydrolase/phosphomutase
MEANRVQNHFLPEMLSRLNAVYLSHGNEIRKRPQRMNLIGDLRELVPYGLQFWAAQLLGENVQDWVVNRTMIGGIDWARTPAFALSSGGEGFIRLNLKGRERDGCLAPEEVDGYTNWLKHEMTRFSVVGAGEPLVSSVIDLQKQFSGPRAHLLPDLAVQWAPCEPAKRIQSPTVGEIRAKLQTGRGGNHTCDSFALVYGDIFPDDAALSVKRIEDLGRLPAYWLNRCAAKLRCRVSS